MSVRGCVWIGIIFSVCKIRRDLAASTDPARECHAPLFRNTTTERRKIQSCWDYEDTDADILILLSRQYN